MLKIDVENPMFREPSYTLLSPRIDLRGTSVNADGLKIDTTVLKDKLQSETVGDNVKHPGKSSAPQIANSIPADIGIGSDTLFEITNGLELLDFGQLPPVERSAPHAQNHHQKSVGTEIEDTGQTQVKLEMKIDPRNFQLAAVVGRSLDLLA